MVPRSGFSWCLRPLMWPTIIVCVSVGLVAPAPAHTVDVAVNVVGSDGMPRVGTLLIARGFAGAGEVFRGLVPAAGAVHFAAAIGPIEIIAACDYDLCATTVEDLEIPPGGLAVTLAVPDGSEGGGNSATCTWYRSLRLLGPDGRVMSNTDFFVRDPLAERHINARTDARGRDVVLAPGPDLGWVVIAYYHGSVLAARLPECRTQPRNACMTDNLRMEPPVGSRIH